MLFTPLKPMLLSNHVATPFSLTDPNLLYEPKYDVWRLLLHKDGSRVEIYTRHGNLVTSRFPEFVEAAANIQARSAILDCEGVCFHPEKQRPDFGLFSVRAKQSNSNKVDAAMRRYPATLVSFDVIMIDGRSLCTESLTDRKKILSDVVPPGPSLIPSLFVVGTGQKLFDLTRSNQWEGICAKSISSTYRINRRPDRLAESWVKHKHTKTTEALILGYQTDPFALLIGFQNLHLERPIPAGVVEFGFKPDEKIAFQRIAQQIHTVKQRNTQMVEPVLKCKVEYLEETDSGALRTCTFRGFLMSGKAV